MAELSTQGLDGLIDDMTALMELPDETVLEMLTAEAEVVAAAQQSEAQSMGVYATGKTAGSISYDKKLKVKGASPAQSTFHRKGRAATETSAETPRSHSSTNTARLDNPPAHSSTQQTKNRQTQPLKRQRVSMTSI